jgi:3-deoxy-manno-octulosonate cytidylyltransferase (CMP-KDO synthetase)
MLNDTLIIIPVRMGASRFPGKPLIDIDGKAMVLRVWEKAVSSKCGDVLVACCDNQVKEYLIDKSIPYVMTEKSIKSGTDRVFHALQLLSNKNLYKYIINLQGDIPNVSTKAIKKLSLIIKKKKIQMATLVSKINNLKKINDQNIVKVALTKSNELDKAVYFSRAPIPFGAKIFYEHIGIYAYTLSTLKKFVHLRAGELEKIESLEQLRALENGIEISVGKVNSAPISIDTPKDLIFFKKNSSLKK